MRVQVGDTEAEWTDDGVVIAVSQQLRSTSPLRVRQSIRLMESDAFDALEALMTVLGVEEDIIRLVRTR